MDNAKMLTPKEVGKRIKERRNEIGISMPELGRRVGVNKSIFGVALRSCFPIASAKLLLFFGLCKFSGNFFQKNLKIPH